MAELVQGLFGKLSTEIWVAFSGDQSPEKSRRTYKEFLRFSKVGESVNIGEVEEL